MQEMVLMYLCKFLKMNLILLRKAPLNLQSLITVNVSPTLMVVPVKVVWSPTIVIVHLVSII